MNLDKYKALTPKQRDLSSTSRRSRYEGENDFWKTLSTERNEAPGAGRHPDDHASTPRRSKAYRRQGLRHRLGGGDQGEPAVRRAAEEAAREVNAAGRASRARLRPAARRRWRSSPALVLFAHDADDLRRRAAAQRALDPGRAAASPGATRSPSAMLYLITMLAAPWLLRRGSTSASTSSCARCRRASPGIASGSPTRSASAAASSMAWYGARAALASYSGGLALDQDAGDAGMVAARAAAGRFALLAIELRVPHAPALPRPSAGRATTR